MTIAKKVLDNIKQHHLAPKPHWVFVVHNVLLWITGCLFLLLGSVAMSIIFYIIDANDWDVYEELGNSILSFTLLSLPYVWFLVFGLVLFAAYRMLRKVEGGYRHALWVVGLSVVLITSVLGGVLYTSGFGARLHFLFSDSVPLYRYVIDTRMHRWGNPNHGTLAGVVTYVSTSLFTVQTPAGEWTITVATGTLREQPREGVRLRLIGHTIAERTFEAKNVLPWFRPHMIRPPARHRSFTPEDHETNFFFMRIMR